ncbi:MAG: hypothetical protein Q4D42_13560 [Eubacteriales bacterium]|nr:hypothetical protein [Eubacteriales bacterium]
MSGRMFRLLRADEIECRVQRVTDKGFSVLLYKDARCDMNILDETVGAMGWQRSHSRENANCTVSIWDQEKSQWISKEDTGTESNTEAQKGLASDSFKRACVNWGIGRELYSAPFIWISPFQGELLQSGQKYKVSPRLKLSVSEIEYGENNAICKLTIVDNTGAVRFQKGASNLKQSKSSPETGIKLVTPEQAKEIAEMCVVLFGMDKWQRMLWKSTGYQSPQEIRAENYQEIKERLQKRLNEQST